MDVAQIAKGGVHLRGPVAVPHNSNDDAFGSVYGEWSCSAGRLCPLRKRPPGDRLEATPMPPQSLPRVSHSFLLLGVCDQTSRPGSHDLFCSPYPLTTFFPSATFA